MTRIPGLRFHPTDDELINYYLKRKVLGKRIRFEVISEIEIYKCAPWDLPDMSCLRTKDREWYFFCPIERKYSNGDRMNRATIHGYWKATGKDRKVLHRDQTVGLIKTLIFHTGKAPKGVRTDWVMHEYRLADNGLAAAGVVQDSYVICKLFEKSGPGPKNGAQYGAPYIEEEWSDDEEVAGIESFSLAGLLAPTGALQDHQQNSAMTSTFISGTMGIGSSSESTHNIFTPQDNNLSLAQNHQQSSAMITTFVAGTMSIGSSSGSPVSNIRRTDYMRRPVQDNNVSSGPNRQQSSAVTSTIVSGTMSIGSSSGSTHSNMGPTNNMLRPVQQYNVPPALHNHQQSSAMKSTFVSGTMSTGSSSGSTFSNIRRTDYMLRPVQENDVLPAPNHQQRSAVTNTFVSGTMSIGSSSGSAFSNMEPTNYMLRPVREYNVSPALQNQQQSSATTSTFVSGTMSTGSSSGSTLSNMRPAENTLRPVQDSVSMHKLPLPVNDDTALMLDWFSDVIIPVQTDNNQNEFLDNVIGGEANVEAAPDDDFYNCLPVPTWDDMYINSSTFSSFATNSSNDDSYLELNDLQSPLVPRRKRRANGEQ